METMETTAKKPSPAQSTPTPSPGKVVIVDIGERQSSEAVNSLRKGEGKLIDNVERIMADLVAAGTIGSMAQPVVFVVRENSPPEDDEDEEDL